MLRSYLEDDGVHVDNDTAVKLGCLELRRFYKDMPQIALKKKENFTMLECVVNNNNWSISVFVDVETKGTILYLELL